MDLTPLAEPPTIASNLAAPTTNDDDNDEPSAGAAEARRRRRRGGDGASSSGSSGVGGGPPQKRTPRGKVGGKASHRGVYLWPRHEHWNHKRDRATGEPKRKAYVKYMGHGGCIDVVRGQPRPPGCSSKAS
jgi:hypothetical protein